MAVEAHCAAPAARLAFCAPGNRRAFSFRINCARCASIVHMRTIAIFTCTAAAIAAVTGALPHSQRAALRMHVPTTTPITLKTA